MPTDADRDDELRDDEQRHDRRPDDEQRSDDDVARGAAEPETLLDGAEDEADTASRLSMESSDPPASWAGPDTPPVNKER